MSRLESYIRRMQAQKLCLDYAAEAVNSKKGLVLELGFGNGRTYDHLRERLPGRPIYVFDRQLNPHPDCVPPPELVRLGEVRETLPRFLEEAPGKAVLIHADIGTGDKRASMALAQALAPTLSRLLAAGGLLAGDQQVVDDDLEPLPLPEGVPAGRYHLYRRRI
jgi:tRNA G46 methylase TrmB